MKFRISRPSLYLILGLVLLLSWTAFAKKETVQATPVVFEVLHLPLDAVKGSDGLYHLVYEIQLTNVSPQAWRVEHVKAVADGQVLSELSGTELESRMGPLSKRGGSRKLGPYQSTLLWMHLKFSSKQKVPEKFQHQISLSGAPQAFVMLGGKVQVSPEEALAIGAPLKGENWVAGDGCCDSVRHVRALLPINGALECSQRFAIDWEKLDESRRIFSGDAKNPENYICYGENVYAVADAEVIAALDGLPDQVPGKLPDSIDIAQADGNHIILRISPNHYALYAHLKAGTLKVKPGDRVKTGQILGQVGNSGNTSEPHLHFHLMDGPSAMASNGLPYVIKAFEIQGKAKSTADFDKAAAEGNPLVIETVTGSLTRQNELPLDLSLVRFP